MLEMGLLIITSLVLVSLEISLIVLIVKHFRNIFDFLDNMEKKYNLFHRELQDIKTRLSNFPKYSSELLLQEKKLDKSTELKSNEAIQMPPVKDPLPSPPLLQNQSGTPPLIRNLKKEEIPENMKKLSILNATKIAKGKPFQINPQRVVVGNPGEQVQINIHTDSKPSR